MPTYEYKCPKGHVFEKFFPAISNRRKVACPKCGKMAERQLSGGAGLVFKGSGFSITDYKRAGEKQESEPKPETKSEPKPDAKSEKKNKKDSPKK